MAVRLEISETTLLADITRPGGGNILIDDGLDTAVMISLFTNRRAEPSDKLPGNSTDRRGWWGDSYAQNEGDLIGSRLWLLEGGKLTEDVVNQSRVYADEALQWMTDDGVAHSVTVETFRRDDLLCMIVTIMRSQDPASRYQRLWEIKLDAI